MCRGGVQPYMTEGFRADRGGVGEGNITPTHQTPRGRWIQIKRKLKRKRKQNRKGGSNLRGAYRAPHAGSPACAFVFVFDLIYAEFEFCTGAPSLHILIDDYKMNMAMSIYVSYYMIASKQTYVRNF